MMTKNLEPLPNLAMSSLADNGSFGIEYMLHAEYEKGRELLKQGIEYCEHVEDKEPEAKEIKKILNELINDERTIDIITARKVQYFLNESSKEFLGYAIKDQRKRERIRLRLRGH